LPGCRRRHRVIGDDLIAADPGLAGIARLRTDWMYGLQFYLREPLPLTNGHVNYVHSPFALQNPGSWYDRPESRTAIGNLALAGDWVRTHLNVTTMDGANDGGRAAANAILDAAGSLQPRVPRWSLYVPPEFEPFRAVDAVNYRLGRPNAFDPDQAPPPRG